MSELKTFIHEVADYPSAKGVDNGWWELGDDGYVYNRSGGRHGYKPQYEKERIKSTWNDIIKHHKELEDIRAIENFSTEDVTVERGPNKKSVVVYDKITPINCMSQLYMICTIE